MPEKSVAEKARIKPGTTFAAENSPEGVIGGLGLPSSVRFVPVTEAQVVCVFIHTRDDAATGIPNAIADMADGAHLWVFFRKGSKAAGRDVNRDDVWSIADRHGLRPLSLLSVDETWSVFRLRKP